MGWGGQWGAYTDVVSAFGPGQMGLILLTHRYYNPDTGRFLTRDPIGYEGGVNVYAYCRNNPVMNSDPSGLTEGWDLFFLAWDAYNITADYVTGASATEIGLDWSAFAIDGALTLIPGAPAGPGHFAMAGAKALAVTDNSIRLGQGLYHTASSAAKLADFAKKQPTVQLERYGNGAEAEETFAKQSVQLRPGHEGQPKWIGERGTVTPKSLGKTGNYTHKMIMYAKPEVLPWLRNEANAINKANEPGRYGIHAAKLQEFNSFVHSIKILKR